MSEFIQIGLNEINTLEIHYYFNDDSHSMDANVLNKCDSEILATIKEVVNIFSVDIVIETEPIGEGGIKKWLKIISKEENKKGVITTSLITIFLTTILTVPLAKISEKLVEKVFEDNEMTELQKEKLRNEIKVLKQYQAQNGLDSLANIDYSLILKKKKSNLYDTLVKYPKVERISFTATDETKRFRFAENIVDRVDFNKFVLITDELEPTIVEGAIIEIIAPVLKKGKYKWIGHYQGESVHFNMKSDELRALVQDGNVEFRNGSSINCQLEIKRRISSEGVEMIVGYDVMRVNHYFQNDKPIETKEGKHYRQVKEAQRNQLNLFESVARQNFD